MLYEDAASLFCKSEEEMGRMVVWFEVFSRRVHRVNASKTRMQVFEKQGRSVRLQVTLSS